MQSSPLAAGLMIPKHLWFIPPLKQEDVPGEPLPPGHGAMGHVFVGTQSR